MVEVFKTNVKDRHHADMLIDQIHKTFYDYQANFDLNDSDKILRVKCSQGAIQPSLLIELLNRHGFHAEILPDDIPVIKRNFWTSINGYEHARVFCPFEN